MEGFREEFYQDSDEPNVTENDSTGDLGSLSQYGVQVQQVLAR